MADDAPPNTASNRSTVIDLPIGEIVRSVALAVVEAQSALDANAMTVAERMSGAEVLRDAAGRPVLDADRNVQMIDRRVVFGTTGAGGARQPTLLSMMELGFTPTFYQFAETVVELRLALRLHQQTDAAGEAQVEVRGAPVDATYRSTYGYDVDGACLVRTRIVPVPAPPLLEERVRLLLEAERRALSAAPKP